MSGRSSVIKGKSFERKVVNDLKSHGFKAKRNLEDIVDNNKVDVLSELIDIQCKRNKKYCSISKLLEVKTDKVRALVTKGDHMPAVICLEWEDFLKIIKERGI